MVLLKYSDSSRNWGRSNLRRQTTDWRKIRFKASQQSRSFHLLENLQIYPVSKTLSFASCLKNEISCKSTVHKKVFIGAQKAPLPPTFYKLWAITTSNSRLCMDRKQIFSRNVMILHLLCFIYFQAN